jgi:large-conductance mechanosensitive channel
MIRLDPERRKGMEETKQKERVYSGEQTVITGPDSLRSTTAATESSGTEKTASKQTQTAQKVFAPAISQTGTAGTIVEFGEFLKRTKRLWLIVAGAVFVMMTVITIVTRVFESTRNAREKRQERAALDVKPENLIARCGPPAEDVTKEMYPMMLRTMSYQRGENEKIVFEFSRTAETKSDWVSLSMKDESGTRSFETPDAKIAALPCLDSTR